MYSTNGFPTPLLSRTHPPNPPAPLLSSPPLRPSTRYQTFDPRSFFGEGITDFPRISQHGQDEALCPAKHRRQVWDPIIEGEEHDEHDGNSTSSNPPPQPDKAKRDPHREPKVLSSKQFPHKLFQMLDDETVTNYVRWSKSGSSNALHIPDTKAFEVNVIPKHFKEMKQWGSFQRQLLNYGFQKQDWGAGKALYTHPGNKFHKGRPDLLPRLPRIPNKKKKAFVGQDSSPAQARPTTPIGGPSPQSEGQIDPNAEEQLEHNNETLKAEILELKIELELSKARHSAVEDQLQETEEQLQATKDQLQETKDQLQATKEELEVTKDRVLVMENQLGGLLRKPDWLSTGNDALNSQVHPGPAGDSRFFFDPLPIPAAASGFPAYHNSSSQSGLSESHLSMGIPYEPLEPSFSLAFLQPEVFAQATTAQQSPL